MQSKFSSSVSIVFCRIYGIGGLKNPSNKFVQKRRPLCFFVCICVCRILVLSSLGYEHLKIKTLLSFIAWSICPPKKNSSFWQCNLRNLGSNKSCCIRYTTWFVARITSFGVDWVLWASATLVEPLGWRFYSFEGWKGERCCWYMLYSINK